MQTVLITGATSGIGLMIANQLHVSGFKVFGTSRFPDQHRAKVDFELLALDVTSEASIRDCMTALSGQTTVIDVLSNNAGNGVNGSAEETSPALARKQFETNFWETVNVTKAVLPLMRQQRSGKIITIGSLAGLIGVPFQSYYAASKHALENFFKSLRIEVKPFGISVSVVEPGFFKTNLAQVFEYADPSIPNYDSTRTKAMSVFSDSIEAAPTPEPVSEVVVKILRSPKPRYSYRVGTDARTLPILQFLSYRFFEWGATRKFTG